MLAPSPIESRQCARQRAGNGRLPLYRPSVGPPPIEPRAVHSRGGTVPSRSSRLDGPSMVLCPASSVTPPATARSYRGHRGEPRAPPDVYQTRRAPPDLLQEHERDDRRQDEAVDHERRQRPPPEIRHQEPDG